MASLTAYIRRLNRSGMPLYVRFDRAELDDAGIGHGDDVRLELPRVVVSGIVKTTGTPWLAPGPDSSNGEISEALVEAGLEHDQDVDATVTVINQSTTAPNRTASVQAEADRRETMWQKLREGGGPERVEPSLPRELRIYGGAQGVWVDAALTREVVPGGPGFAVGLLHTGRHYADELDEDGVIYHYPTTNRPPSRDQNEIESIRACGEMQLPIFFIEHAPSGTRTVRRAWLVDDDPTARKFYLSFDESEAVTADTETVEETPFTLDDTDRERRKSSGGVQRSGQTRFRFDVLKRYGPACAVCGLAVDDLLEAAHLKPWSKRGTDDPRNGLPMCRNHHRSFDRGLLGIDPETYRLVARDAGPSLAELRIPMEDLSALSKLPSSEALEWVWNNVFRKAGGG